VGQQVAAGQVVLLMEAMKMETEIRASQAGIVSQLHVSVGSAVSTGDLLVSFA
jgi:oxaloacetate decarboxylase alpha subunit